MPLLAICPFPHSPSLPATICPCSYSPSLPATSLPPTPAQVLSEATRALSDSLSRGEVVSHPASPWLFKPLRKSQAYATLLTTDNADYLRGALVLGSSIRSFDSTRDMVCLVTSAVPIEWRKALTVAGWTVAVVDTVAEFWFGKTEECSHFDSDQAERWGHMATKLRLWQQRQYERILYLDADTVLTGDASDIFDTAESFAAERGRFHSHFNAGVMMLSPSEATYRALLAEGAKEPKRVFGNVVDCTEQGLLNSYFDGSSPERAVAKLSVGRADVANDWQAAGAPFAVHWITHSCPKPWVVADGEAAVPVSCDAVVYSYWRRVWGRLTSSTVPGSGSTKPRQRMLRRLGQAYLDVDTEWWWDRPGKGGGKGGGKGPGGGWPRPPVDEPWPPCEYDCDQPPEPEPDCPPWKPDCHDDEPPEPEPDCPPWKPDCYDDGEPDPEPCPPWKPDCHEDEPCPPWWPNCHPRPPDDCEYDCDYPIDPSPSPEPHPWPSPDPYPWPYPSPCPEPLPAPMPDPGTCRPPCDYPREVFDGDSCVAIQDLIIPPPSPPPPSPPPAPPPCTPPPRYDDL